MAIIPKYSLNEKFENGKKPPQWDFWAWQDSYWHKDEKIPTSAIEGLDARLQKKADLVDGMVPENQLPFSVVTSEVLALGKVEIIDNKVKLEVHSSGANKVRVKGKLITRIFPNEWPFTPIAGSGIKVLRGYAVKNEDDFFMVEGAELPEMTDPEIPENALQLFRLTISSAGVIVEEETEEVFKYRSDDNWRPLIINTNAGVWLQFGGSGASSFNITVAGSVTAPKIVGLATKVTKNIWNGKESLLYNDSNVAVAILKDQILPTAPNATFINFAEDYVLQPKSYNLIKQKGNQIVVVKYGGGSANFPAGGNDGEVLLKSGTGGIWSSIIKGVEFLGNAWLKLKMISFQGYTIAQKNVIASPNEGMLIYQNENPKGFQVYENGAWRESSKNISNTDLTTVSARIFSLGNAFTINTNGFGYFLKGLIDKTGNTNYTKVVVVHPTSGETVTRDFADPANTTLAIQRSSTAEKTAMRTALLGTATPANPALQGVTSSFIEKDVETIIGIYGLNLTLLDPSFIYIELPDLTKIYATNFANINQYLVRVTWLIPNAVPIGNYAIKIQNGVAVQGLSKATVNIIDGGLVKYIFQANEWIIRRKSEASTAGVIKSNDYLRFPLENAGYRAKSNNVFSGSISAQWEFSVAINKEVSGGSGSLTDLTYFFGLTPVSNTNFSTYEGMLFNNGLSLKTDGFVLFDNLNNSLISNIFTAGILRIHVTKPTGSKAYFFIENNNNFYFMQTFDLDPSIVYAMFLYKPNKDGSNNLGFECFFESKIVN